MNWSVAKIGTIYQKPAHAIGLSTPPIGCVLYLPGLPGGGNKIYDRSPYGNNGTITGATWTRLPSGLWVLSYDAASDDLINCGDITQLDSISALTIIGWFKQTVLDTNARFIFKQDPAHVTDGNLDMQVAGGNLYLSLCNGGDSYGYFDYSTLVTADKFFHFAMVFDGSQTGNAARLKLYFDTTQATLSFGGIIPATTRVMSGYNFYIGNKYSADAGLNGGVGLMQILLRALSVLEIQNHYQQEKHLFGVW